jgi:DNA helicase II / ATP-dependent DNA helicase PcrA
VDISHILNQLNEPQRQAASASPGHLLVLAGAGSGKTRVLVHRIAWLVEVEKVSPFSILSVTFTNKAAAEMRGRVETLLGVSTQGMWIGTFHSLAHRLLRMHWEAARLPQTFQILDGDDQYRLIKRVIVALGLDEERWSPKHAQSFINVKKPVNEVDWLILPNCYYVPTSYGSIIQICLPIINNAFITCWWMNFKILIQFNMLGYDYW